MTVPAETKLLTHRIVEALYPDGEPTRATVAGRARMLPTVTAAHCAGRTIACCWMRARPHGRVAVLAGDFDFLSPRPGPAAVPFPAGAQGIFMRADQVARAVDRIPHWRQAEVALDCLDHPRDQGSFGESPGMDELFALMPDRPAAMLVVAEPLGAVAMEHRVTGLSDLVGQLEVRRAGRGRDRIRLNRAEAELAYLERWAAQGLWDLRLWTAGETEDSCDAMLALIAGSGDLVDLPLRVRPVRVAGAMPSQLAWATACAVGADAVAALARPPGRELPGFRLSTSPDFDRTPEIQGELQLGSVLDATGAPAGPFGVPRDSVNRHVFVTGATGSGKSQTVRTLLERLTATDVPWLVIEPAKAEYAMMAGRTAGAPVVVIRPGLPHAAPASLNPLEPSSITVNGTVLRFPLQTHVDLVRALFTASFEAPEPFPQILAGALTRCYHDLGWNMTVGRALDGDADPRWPTLEDLQRQAMAAIDDVGYGTELRQNMRGFVAVRIDSLRLGTPGRFFQGGHPLDLERMLTQRVVFEIEDLGDDNDKAFFIGCVLIRLIEVLRLRERHGLLTPGLNHVTVIEEAHRLLRRVAESSAAQAVTMFANLLAEIRAYGEGIVVAEQIPAKLMSDVVKNSAVKIMHRLPAKDDRDFVGATMNLGTRQSEHVVALRPGEAAAHVDGMDRPILLAVDGSGRSRESRQGVSTQAPVWPRDAGCPQSCRATPCTLDQIVQAENLPNTRKIRLWAEVSVAAALVGAAPGTLSPTWVAELTALDPGRLRCAIGAATTAAVARRSHHIRRWYEPSDLTRQLSTHLHRQLADNRDHGEPHLRWRIGQFRWAAVLRVLRAEPVPGENPANPHPRTASWSKLGLPVPGRNWGEQWQAAHLAAQRASIWATDVIGGTPAILNDLAAGITTGQTPAERLERAVAMLGLETAWLMFRMRDSQGAQ